MNRYPAIFTAAAFTVLFAIGGAAGSVIADDDLATAPATASPGSMLAAVDISGPCPTFSWGSVSGARGFELVVLAIDEEEALTDENTQRPEFRAEISGPVHSWTPDATRCFEPGRRYGWSVRAVLEASSGAWSEPRYFAVAETTLAQMVGIANPTGSATEQTVSRHGSRPPTAPPLAGAAPPISPTRATVASSAPDSLVTDGNTVAASFRLTEPQTGFAAIATPGFSPIAPSVVFSRQSNGSLSFANAKKVEVQAAVSLPHRVNIEGISCFYRDEDPNRNMNVLATLLAKNGANSQTLQIATAFGETSEGQLTISSPELFLPELVDNGAFNYYIRSIMTSNLGNLTPALKFDGCNVRYSWTVLER